MLITYAGGPIVRCPRFYTSFWGPAWSDSAHQTLAGQLNQFHQDILRSNYMNVLTQYGVLKGAGTGAFIQASYLPGVPSTLTVPDYVAILQQCINIGAIPEPQDASTTISVDVLVIYLDENTIINGGGRQLNFPGAPDIGFHDHFTTTAGHQFYYAFVAYFSDVNSNTIVASHELAEMITDPQYDAWTPDSGFTEIGDLCEGSNDTITVGSDTWTVQQIYSDTNSACVTQAASPLTPLSPGPAGAAAIGEPVRGRGPRPVARQVSYERFLPLPSLHVDLGAGTFSLDDREISSYLRKTFYPLRHQDLIGGNLIATLRPIMDMLEKGSRERAAGAAQAEPLIHAHESKGVVRREGGSGGD